MRKNINKLLSAIVCLCLVFSIGTGALAIDLPVPVGGKKVQIPLSINTSANAFATVEFAISFTEGLTFVKYEKSDTVKSASSGPVTYKDGKTYLGFFSDSNAFTPEYNSETKTYKVNIGYLEFEYHDDGAETVTVSEIQIYRLDGTTKIITDKLSDETITIKRATENTGDGDDTGGYVNPGGSYTTGTVQLGENETPLAEGAAVYAPFISGFPDGTVRPTGELTRAQLAQIIYNLYGDEDESYTADYTDVAGDHWAITPIAFCQESGYMLGYPGGTFDPERPLTRAEISTALVRLKNLTPTSNHPFTDIDSDHWAVGEIGAMCAVGYVSGDPEGTFRPDSSVNRAEATKMLCNAEGRDFELFDTVRTFSDLQTDFWGYKYMMNAANGYNYL